MHASAHLVTGDVARFAEFEPLMEYLATLGEQSYRDFTKTMPGVLEYFYATTPVRALGALNIGSRPSHRQSTDLSKHSIRAIPWVFGWAQSRHMLPGWFGLGSALRTFSAADKMTAAQLQRMHQYWPFFRSLIDNTQTALAKADMETAAEYASLTQNTAQGEAIIYRARSEYAASTEQALLISEQRELLVRNHNWRYRLCAAARISTH